jgi:copper chaperone CopZ
MHFPGAFLRVLIFFGVVCLVQSLRTGYCVERPANPQVVITIKGMMCASCGREIEKNLNKVSGVVSIKVDSANDRATINYDRSKVTPQQLVEVIRKSGYEAILPVP